MYVLADTTARFKDRNFQERACSSADDLATEAPFRASTARTGNSFSIAVNANGFELTAVRRHADAQTVGMITQHPASGERPLAICCKPSRLAA